VRPGLRASLLAKLRPLPALELEPSLRQALLRHDGVNNYRESAQQWLAVWHFDARHSLRAIAQRASLRRLAEAVVALRPNLSVCAWLPASSIVRPAGGEGTGGDSAPTRNLTALRIPVRKCPVRKCRAAP